MLKLEVSTGEYGILHADNDVCLASVDSIDSAHKRITVTLVYDELEMRYLDGNRHELVKVHLK